MWSIPKDFKKIRNYDWNCGMKTFPDVAVELFAVAIKKF